MNKPMNSSTNKPEIICYMMTSVDGRIDCAMTANLPGVEDYYPLLDAFQFDATVSGRRTAELEMALPGKFEARNSSPIHQEKISNKAHGPKPFDVVMATHGGLLWNKAETCANPLIMVCSEQVPAEYLEYLDDQNISYIATGEKEINLARAVEILHDEFGINRLGIVGGATINTGFLDAGLLDEVDVLIGAGIDGRAQFPPVFNRQDNGTPLTKLKLLGVEHKPGSEAVLLRYQVLNQ